MLKDMYVGELAIDPNAPVQTITAASIAERKAKDSQNDSFSVLYAFLPVILAALVYYHYITSK